MDARRFIPLARLAGLLGLLTLVGPPALLAAQVQDNATMTVLRGQVAVVHPDGSAVQPAPSGTTVAAGDEIRTLAGAGALITFFAGTEIEMGQDTTLVVQQVSRDGDRVDISLKQVLGSTINHVTALTNTGSVYRIEAGGAVAVVRGTAFVILGPIATARGDVVVLACRDDCDGRSTFAGCPLAPYTGYVVAVSGDRQASGCQPFAVARGADFLVAASEAAATAEQLLWGAASPPAVGTEVDGQP